MNKLSTEHVTKKIQLALNYTKKLNLNLLLVITLACAGLSAVYLSPESFICNSQSAEAHLPLRNISTNGYALRVIDEPSIFDGPSTNNSLLANMDKPNLEVAGIREIDESLIFEMSEFNENITYKIDFGNGKSQILSQATIPYAYQAPGTYKVTVTGLHSGEQRVLSTSHLMVADAMETPDFIAESKI